MALCTVRIWREISAAALQGGRVSEQRRVWRASSTRQRSLRRRWWGRGWTGTWLRWSGATCSAGKKSNTSLLHTSHFTRRKCLKRTEWVSKSQDKQSLFWKLIALFLSLSLFFHRLIKHEMSHKEGYFKQWSHVSWCCKVLHGSHTAASCCFIIKL